MRAFLRKTQGCLETKEKPTENGWARVHKGGCFDKFTFLLQDFEVPKDTFVTCSKR